MRPRRRHVLPVLALAAGLTGAAPALGAWNVAIRNPDGSTVVLVNNDDWGTGSQRFNLVQGSQELSYDLPAGAVATFVID